MSWTLGLDLIAQNINISMEVLLALIVNFTCLISYAKDVRIGLLFSFFANGLCFAWVYTMGNNYVIFMVLMFIFMILLSLSIYATYKSTSRLGVI